MAKSAAPMAIDRPAAGFEILLEELDQAIDPAIQHGTAVQVHDLVGATPVIPRPQPAISAAFQRDDRPIAVSQRLAGRKDGPHGSIKTGDAMEGLAHLPGFPTGLGPVLERLKTASSAVVGQDAGGTAPIGRGTDDAGDLG